MNVVDFLKITKFSEWYIFVGDDFRMQQYCIQVYSRFNSGDEIYWLDSYKQIVKQGLIVKELPTNVIMYDPEWEECQKSELKKVIFLVNNLTPQKLSGLKKKYPTRIVDFSSNEKHSSILEKYQPFTKVSKENLKFLYKSCNYNLTQLLYKNILIKSLMEKGYEEIDIFKEVISDINKYNINVFQMVDLLLLNRNYKEIFKLDKLLHDKNEDYLGFFQLVINNIFDAIYYPNLKNMYNKDKIKKINAQYSMELLKKLAKFTTFYIEKVKKGEVNKNSILSKYIIKFHEILEEN